jgi:hypothetical protein
VGGVGRVVRVEEVAAVGVRVSPPRSYRGDEETT